MTPPISVGTVEIDLEDGPIRFDLRRSSRRSIGITVRPGGTVVVTAPFRAPLGKVHAFLRKNGAWVRRKIVELRDAPAPPPPPKWVEGELHRYLGRDYPLRLFEGDRGVVWLTDQELLVHTPQPRERERVRGLVEGWMLEEARALFLHRMHALIRVTPALRLRAAPTLNLRRMTSRWGSCSPKGRILMNTHAIKLPLRLVDYILMHELCHLNVPNHSREFWDHLTDCLPDWENRKRMLDEQVV